MQEATQAGKLPLPELEDRVHTLANAISQMDMEGQRKEFMTCHVSAMQMSLRLLAGETITLAEETAGLYDISPAWKEESHFI